MADFLQVMITGIAMGSLYGLVALGFVVILKSSGVFNIAQGEMMAIGAFVLYTLAVSLHIPLLLAVLITLITTSLMGLVIERLLIRPLTGEPIMAKIMITIALAIFLRSVILSIWGSLPLSYSEILPLRLLHLGPVVVSQHYPYTFLLAGITLILLVLFFKYSRHGLAIRAAADDQQAAQAVGISVGMVGVLSWSIAAMMATVGGMILGTMGGVHYTLANVGLAALAVVILGGIESIPGAIVAGVIVGVLQQLTGGYIDPLVGGGVKEVVPYLVMVLILLVRPDGLFGQKRIERV